MNSNQLRAGAGKAVIEFPDEFFPQENFTGIHDNIHVRVVILECNKRIALVSLELTSFPDPEGDLLKNLINSITDISQEDIWILVTHSFSSPHFFPRVQQQNDIELKHKMDLLRQSIHGAARKAAALAVQSMQDAQLGVSSGECDVNVNRDVSTEAGWWIGFNPEGYSDKTLTVLRIDRINGGKGDHPLAILFNYNVQSAVMDGSLMKDGTKLITSDLAGKAADYVESYHEDSTVAMFLLGAAGDQSPVKKAKTVEVDSSGNLKERDIQEKGFEFVAELGEQLGKETIAAADKATTYLEPEEIKTDKSEFACPGQKMPESIKFLHPTLCYEFIKDEDRTLSMEAVTIGAVALLGIRPELNDKTGREIKKASPFSYTLVATMVNGGAKYMADSEAYDRMTYESMNSFFGKGSAEILTEKVLELLERMKKQI